MPLKISADFLLGVYQGHDKNGRAESYPDLVRLQAAFISAAYGLFQYEKQNEVGTALDESLGLPEDMAAAIRWFEDNPPQAITLPTVFRNEPEDVKSFRNKGLVVKTKGVIGDKKAEELALSQSTLMGPIVWWWREEPEVDIQKILERLSCEIPYLGEAASPVVVKVQTEEAIPEDVWTMVEGLGLQYLGYPSFSIPLHGRADALQTAFTEREGKKMPSVASDKCGTSESEISDSWLDRFRGTVIYRDAHENDEDGLLPWNFGYILDAEAESSKNADWLPAENEYVRWSVAFHRALTSKCGNDIPRILTGKGTKSAGEVSQLPANGVSIQILDRSLPLSESAAVKGTAFLVMLPVGADEEDVKTLDQAVCSLKRVYDSKLGAVKITGVRQVRLSILWKAPQSGFKRWWQPRPLYISDNRPPYKNTGRRPAWTLSDSIRVSIGYVWRDMLNPVESGSKRMLELDHAVEDQDVVVAGTRPIYAVRPNDYSYHMNDGSFFSAATALIDLGKLCSDRAAVAIGQTRHIGGGLLVPVDLPNGVAEQMLHRDTDEGR